MQDRPPGVTDSDLAAALAAGWGIEARSLTYRPVGAGSYHWSLRDAGGAPWWVTVSGAAFDRLERAMRTALTLRRHDFVVAPVPTTSGAPLRPLNAAFTVTVFPLVDGAAGTFGPHPPEDRPAVVDLLVALHRATPSVSTVAGRTDLRLPGREELADLDHSWDNGPYGAAARAVLTGNADRIAGWLAEFDRLAAEVAAAGTPWVVTHGEPHPGNLMRTPPGALRLIDWDTTLIAPPERDLWMLADEESLARYHAATGHEPDPAALALYPLWWKLADVAVYTADLRRPHTTGGDAAAALTYLTSYFTEPPP